MKTKRISFFKLISKCIFSFLFFAVSGVVSADDHHDDQKGKRPGKSQNDQHDFNHALNDIKNEIKSGRLVSISTVKPIEDNMAEIDFFTASLKLVSKSNPTENIQ